MTKVNLSEQAQQTVDRTRARFLVVQPDGTIKRRGEWAFNKEANVRNLLAKQPELKAYDRTSGEYFTADMSTAVIPEVTSAPVTSTDPTPAGHIEDAQPGA